MQVVEANGIRTSPLIFEFWLSLMLELKEVFFSFLLLTFILNYKHTDKIGNMHTTKGKNS